MKKEFNFEGAKKGARVNPSKTKIVITARLDMDVIMWLKQEAEKRGLPYQTLMNSILKDQANGNKTSLEEDPGFKKAVLSIVNQEFKRKRA
jgi:uncharacterized protein (DUF4415 family)